MRLFLTLILFMTTAYATEKPQPLNDTFQLYIDAIEKLDDPIAMCEKNKGLCRRNRGAIFNLDLLNKEPSPGTPEEKQLLGKVLLTVCEMVCSKTDKKGWRESYGFQNGAKNFLEDHLKPKLLTPQEINMQATEEIMRISTIKNTNDIRLINDDILKRMRSIEDDNKLKVSLYKGQENLPVSQQKFTIKFIDDRGMALGYAWTYLSVDPYRNLMAAERNVRALLKEDTPPFILSVPNWITLSLLSKALNKLLNIKNSGAADILKSARIPAGLEDKTPQ